MSSRRRSKPKASAEPTRDFWFTPASAVALAPPIRPAADPTALVRSLGRPPVAGLETTAEHYLNAVYDKTARLAVALAAANGLLADEDLPD